MAAVGSYKDVRIGCAVKADVIAECFAVFKAQLSHCLNREIAMRDDFVQELMSNAQFALITEFDARVTQTGDCI